MTQTVERVAPLIASSDIWIVTNENYVEKIAAHAPKVPFKQIITEPFPLGTNLAVGLGAIHIARQNPDAVILVGWADSYIGQEEVFRDALQRSELLASEVDGVILGVKPTYPATIYGYIEAGNPISGRQGAFRINRFEEKPNADRAEQFFKSQSHFWNPGISVWKVSSLLDLICRFKPDHYNALKFVAEAIGTPDEAAIIEEAFSGLDQMPIDNAIFEKASNMATILVDLDWNDIGSWSAVYEVQSNSAVNSNSNVIHGSVVSVDTNKCLIYSQKRLIATLGVSDLVIVETDDAILIVHKNEIERMKELYDEVKTYGGTQYL
jgi:mannose-1-phosphate guanylyltransferase